MNLSEEFERTLRDTADRLGVELEGNLDVVREYAADTMLTLRLSVDEPGYAEVLVAAGINVTLAAAGAAVSSADALDRELIGVVVGLLGMGARALSGGVV